jgi:hypothetical protein
MGVFEIVFINRAGKKRRRRKNSWIICPARAPARLNSFPIVFSEFKTVSPTILIELGADPLVRSL